MYSAEEAAQILGLQVRTVRNYVREGRLPGVRIGKQYRIARADLDAFTAGGAAREEPSGGHADRQAASPPEAAAEVSSVVQIDGIAEAASARLERTLLAATLAAEDEGEGEGAGMLRVEPLYDEQRRRLKLIIVGSVGETVELLRIIELFSRESG